MIRLDAKGWWLSAACPGVAIALLTTALTGFLAVLLFIGIMYLRKRFGIS